MANVGIRPVPNTAWCFEMNFQFSTRLSVSVLGAVLSLLGCAGSREGYFYEAQAPRTGAVVFRNAGSKAGMVLAQLTDGEQCRGSFNTVPGVVQRDSDTDRVDREESQTGLAILECNPGHVVSCGFERDHAGAGYGHCTDTHGREFDLYF